MKITVRQLKRIIQEAVADASGFTLVLTPSYLSKTGDSNNPNLSDVTSYETGPGRQDRDPISAASNIDGSVHLVFKDKSAAMQWVQWNDDEGIFEIKRSFLTKFDSSSNQVTLDGKDIKMLDY